ncbi:MAG: tyrosine-protein phosphatase [Wenzhouxiangella sp.]
MLIDIHCHMLPGIDDGAKDMAQALSMARLAVTDGIRTVVVTPHHLNGVYVNRASTIQSVLNSFREALLGEGIGLKILPGSELHLVPELPAELAAGHAMTLANQGRFVLVELPVHTVPMGSEQILDQIISQGLTPIIAHPERNRQLCQNEDLLADWVSMGCLAQATAQSCTGQFGPAAQSAVRTMIAGGLVHFLASDAHRDRRRVPQLTIAREAVARWTSPAVAELLTETFPEAVINGKAPDLEQLADALPVQRRGLWQRVFG